MTSGRHVKILMYHSIANGPGPLAIPVEIFRRQLDALADCGLCGVALRDYMGSVDAGQPTDRLAVLTFDDGYGDFATAVVPELESRGWSGTVFIPSGLIGSPSGWNPDGHGLRQLIDWKQAADVSRRGFEIGSHAVTHTDLTQLDFKEACREIDASKQTLERQIGSAVVSFAAPYGRTTPKLRAHVSKVFQCAVGTSMSETTDGSDRYDLPRIDMWYFRNAGRWRAYLDGAKTYFAVRRVLRDVRRGIRVR